MSKPDRFPMTISDKTRIYQINIHPQAMDKGEIKRYIRELNIKF